MHEPGCGKTVSALSILKLTPKPGEIAGGEILFKGQDLCALDERAMQKIRGAEIAMIFQEPMTALNPVFTIGNQIAEGILLHQNVSTKEAWDRAIEMLTKVQIPNAKQRVNEYPHQLSGGMRQRAMFAMALACNPSLLIADEPTTALDVTIQAQVLDLMIEMKQQFGASIILITHDLGVVAQTCDKVVVMYAGKVAEVAPVNNLFDNPCHPYTIGLLDSIPTRKKGGRLSEIKGVVPTLLDRPDGCYYNPRCPKVMDICREKSPKLKKTGADSMAACWLH